MNRQRVAAIIIKDKKILLAKDARSNFFSIPWGQVEENESHEDALIRELQEEMKASMKEATHYYSFDLINQVYNVPQTDHTYIVSIEGEPTPSAEIIEIGWFTKDDILQRTIDVPPEFYDTLFPKLIEEHLL